MRKKDDTGERKGDDLDGPSPELARELQIVRYRDILIFVPFLAAAVFVTPAIDFDLGGRSVFGIPMRVVLIFSFWLLMALVVFVTNKNMRAKMRERADIPLGEPRDDGAS